MPDRRGQMAETRPLGSVPIETRSASDGHKKKKKFQIPNSIEVPGDSEAVREWFGGRNATVRERANRNPERQRRA